MGYEARLITPFINSGLSQYFKPFLTGDTAFPDIEDAYPWRGRVKKREGTNLFSTIATTPVQGLKTWINPSTLVPNSIAFSRTKAYGYNGTNYVDISQLTDGATTFSFGTGQFNYYWASNYAGSLFVCNGQVSTNFAGSLNGIMYLTANAINSWNVYTPQVDGTPTYLNGALIILPYKGHLVALNTIEGNADQSVNTTFSNRARWCALGSPYVATYNKVGGGAGATTIPAPFLAANNTWRSDIPGQGGFNDADTSERIVSAAIIKDVLIVGFQRSTWRLRYTGNEVLPFVWERLNTQLGCESTYSVVPFDDSALFFSRFGWIAATTNAVARIDEAIPDVSFAFETGTSTFDNLATVQGIRDFYRQMAYWTYTNIADVVDQQIYAYNYIDKSWSVFNPKTPITCFGEFFNTVDETWATYTSNWSTYNTVDDQWQNLGSSQNAGFPVILGGDASGNIYTMFEFQGPPTADNGTNFNFSIQTKRFNPYFESGQKCRMGYVDLYVTTNTYGEINFQHYVDDHQFPVVNRNVTLYPRGCLPISTITAGATTTIVTTSAHNLTTNQVVHLANVYGAGMTNLNNNPQPCTVIDATTFTLPIVTTGSATALGYAWLPPFDTGDARYTRIFLGAVGYMHQFIITLTDQQVADPVVGRAQFEMQGLVIWTRPTGGRIRG